MNRLAKIRHNFSHRRSKSDSQMLDNWSTDCLQPDDDEDLEEPPAIMIEASVADDPISVDSNPPIGTGSESNKTGSTSSLPFFANFAIEFRKKLASDSNLLFRQASDDGTKLHSNADSETFSFDNDGLRKSAGFEETKPKEVPESSTGQSEVAWVTFDDNFPPTEIAAEFVEIPLDGAENSSKEDSGSNRLMQNLKKLPMRFLKNQRYKSLQPETEEEEDEDPSSADSRNFFRTSSLPSSPSMRKKFASAFSRRQ